MLPLVLQRGLHMGQRLATKAMGMTSGLIYEKMSLRKDMDPHDYEITGITLVLKLRTLTLPSYLLAINCSPLHIFNCNNIELMSVDVKRIGQGWKSAFYLMIYPTMVIIATIQLYGYIGNSAWAAAVAVIVWYPISALASFLFSGRFDPAAVRMERSDALASDVSERKWALCMKNGMHESKFTV